MSKLSITLLLTTATLALAGCGDPSSKAAATDDTAAMASDVKTGTDERTGTDVRTGTDERTGTDVRTGTDERTGTDVRTGTDERTGTEEQ